MRRHSNYDISAKWDDPWESRNELRSAERFRIDNRLSISVPCPETHNYLTGPGLVHDISQTGVAVRTKHRLEPKQIVSVSIPTEGCPESLCLPQSFDCKAEVVRVVELKDRQSLVALSFSQQFSQDMEFAVYMNTIQTISDTLAVG